MKKLFLGLMFVGFFVFSGCVASNAIQQNDSPAVKISKLTKQVAVLNVQVAKDVKVIKTVKVERNVIALLLLALLILVYNMADKIKAIMKKIISGIKPLIGKLVAAIKALIAKIWKKKVVVPVATTVTQVVPAK